MRNRLVWAAKKWFGKNAEPFVGGEGDRRLIGQQDSD